MKLLMKFLSIGFVIFILSSCAVTKDYERAVSINSISTYENYQKKFPKSKYKQDVNKRLHILYDEQAWRQSVSKNSIYGFENYIKKFPSGKYVNDAKSEIRIIKEENAWAVAQDVNTINSYSKFLQTYPYGKYKYSANLKIEKLKEEKYVLPIWKVVKAKNTYKAYSGFLYKYPNSSYAELAKRRMNEIEETDWAIASRENTIRSYKEYSKKFPNGKYADISEKKIIDLEVDKIFKGDFGKLPPMNKSSHGYSSYSTSNTVEIYNNTRYTLTVRYSGVESKKIVLSPQERKSTTLKNGNYRIAASVNASNVTNYAGKENLSGGDYSSEYYIQTQTYRIW